jgi:mono/diheme cytochrome c family protein
MADNRQDGPLYGLLAEFATVGALLHAAAKVRDAGFKKWDSYSPFPVHGIDKAMGTKPTILPWLVFLGGTFGCVGGLGLQWWANAYDWPWIISGKPFFSIPANIPITFEATILISGFTAFLGMWALNGLPKLWHPLFRNDRFAKVTDNKFFIGIEAADPQFTLDGTTALLEQAGAVAVETCHLDPDPKRNRMPSGILTFVVLTTLLAIIPVLILASARASTTSEPRIHVFDDMDQQFKDKSESTTDLFEDHRGMRPPVEGTVAYGELHEDDHFYRGIVKTAEPGVEPAPVAEPAPEPPQPQVAVPGTEPAVPAAEPSEPAAPPAEYRWADTFPIANAAQGALGITLDEQTMARGRERYDIYCAPCHGLSGRGDGMIHQRAQKVANRWTPPVDLQSERIVRLPHGQLFFTIGNGVRNMPGYAAQLTPQDRWAIVLYLRALQRSQSATVDDVPADQRGAIR